MGNSPGDGTGGCCPDRSHSPDHPWHLNCGHWKNRRSSEDDCRQHIQLNTRGDDAGLCRLGRFGWSRKLKGRRSSRSRRRTYSLLGVRDRLRYGWRRAARSGHVPIPLTRSDPGRGNTPETDRQELGHKAELSHPIIGHCAAGILVPRADIASAARLCRLWLCCFPSDQEEFFKPSG